MSDSVVKLAEMDIAIVDVCSRLQRKINERPRSQTYDDLAGMADVHYSWIERFARNRISNPSFDNVVKLWHACYGVDPLKHGFVTVV